MAEMDAVDLEAAPACAHGKFRVEPKAINETDMPGTWSLSAQIVCRDCGLVMTLVTPSGFDDQARIVFGGVDLKQQMVAFRQQQKLAQDQKKAADAVRRTLAVGEHAKSKGDPAKGLPGTEMLSLTESFGIQSPDGCGCKTMAAMMDNLGLAECRARAADLRLTMAASWDSWGWRAKLSAVTAAVWNGAGLKVSPTDPIRDLLELAFERAEAKMNETQPA